MSSSIGRETSIDGKTVSFAERYASSEAFEAIYREGMALVEETASYLDGTGRKEAKALKPPVSLAYATESMRLTTRLMQLASWLLIRKALNDGEMSDAEARNEQRKVRLTAIGRPAHTKDFAALPQRLQDLVAHSFSLYDRVLKLDRMLDERGLESGNVVVLSSVQDQMSRLQAAFGARTRRD